MSRASLGAGFRTEDGATSVEYGLLAAAVGIVLIAVAPGLRDAFLSLLRMITEGMLGA